MLNFLLAAGIFFTLLILIASSVVVGRRFGFQELKIHPEHKLEVVSVAEGSVFALLGLLIAFSFSGAYGRFEERKMHIIQESNIFTTAYLRIDLIAPDKQAPMREAFRQYLDYHLAAYHDFPYYKQVYKDVDQDKILQNKIWKLAVAACEEDSNKGLALLFIPTINDMFDITNTGFDLTEVHPPVVIFGLLIGLAVLGSFLAGFTTVKNKLHKSIHVYCYVLLTAFTIYVIIDLELPRLGLIRVDSFDRILINVRNQM